MQRSQGAQESIKPSVLTRRYQPGRKMMSGEAPSLCTSLGFSAAKATPTKSTKPTGVGWKPPKGDLVTFIAANSFAQISERNNEMLCLEITGEVCNA